ncbi:HU family DNA-binding protein [Phocaeicola sp.]
MAIKYDFKANQFVKEGDKKVLYPCVVVSRTMTTEDMVADIAKHTTFSAGCVEGVLAEVNNYITDRLREGYNVRIDDLGTFSLSLSSRPVTNKDEIRAASIELDKVNFRPVPDLIKEVRYGAEFERAENGFKESSVKYTKAQRLELLKKYLEREGSITLKEYIRLTGLARSTASREMKAWEETGDIDSRGRHSHVEYILKGK